MTATREAETVEPTRPVGRPTQYDPSFCDVVIELGKQGYSQTEMAAHFEVAKQTLSLWKDTHPEFMDAVTRANSLSQSWWEQQARQGLVDGKINAQLFKIIAYNRFRDDYADRKEVSIEANHTVHHNVLSGLAGAAGQIEQGQVIDAEVIEVASDDGDDE